MIKLNIDIPKYEWEVIVLLDCSVEDIAEINNNMLLFKCPKTTLTNTILLFKNGETLGFTYSNYLHHKSLICTRHTAIKKELLNTIVHEAYHFIELLARTFNILEEEDRAILIGDFVMLLYGPLYSLL